MAEANASGDIVVLLLVIAMVDFVLDEVVAAAVKRAGDAASSSPADCRMLFFRVEIRWALNAL